MDASYAINLMTAPAASGAYDLVIRASEGGLAAPAIFWYEAASGLRGMALRGQVSAPTRSVVLRRIRELDVVIDPTTPEMDPVISVSDRFQLTIYDAAYLELAIRIGADLATSDRALIAAAPRAGVRLVAQ